MMMKGSAEELREGYKIENRLNLGHYSNRREGGPKAGWDNKGKPGCHEIFALDRNIW